MIKTGTVEQARKNYFRQGGRRFQKLIISHVRSGNLRVWTNVTNENYEYCLYFIVVFINILFLSLFKLSYYFHVCPFFCINFVCLIFNIFFYLSDFIFVCSSLFLICFAPMDSLPLFSLYIVRRRGLFYHVLNTSSFNIDKCTIHVHIYMYIS